MGRYRRLIYWHFKDCVKAVSYTHLDVYKRQVYDLMPDGVLEELQRKNPVDEKIHRRRYRHHQFLTETTGIDYLDKHLVSLINMMRAFDTWDEFDKAFRKSFNLDEKQSGH